MFSALLPLSSWYLRQKDLRVACFASLFILRARCCYILLVFYFCFSIFLADFTDVSSEAKLVSNSGANVVSTLSKLSCSAPIVAGSPLTRRSIVKVRSCVVDNICLFLRCPAIVAWVRTFSSILRCLFSSNVVLFFYAGWSAVVLLGWCLRVFV